MRGILLVTFLFIHIFIFAQKNETNYWIGKSTGKLPALLYGTGDDRLGGTKLGYIDSYIPFNFLNFIAPLLRNPISGMILFFQLNLFI